MLSACAPVQKEFTQEPSSAVEDTAATWLGRKTRAGDPGDGRSGVYLLPQGDEAFAARLELSKRAERTIDAQYYLVHNDRAGHVFAQQLLVAADRGVRVRLLIDDMDTAGYDAMTAALDTHPNIEIRLFNPFWRERGKALTALLDFQRINRRMHNKSMTFDNQVTIVGGRNIGEEYFSASADSNYDDLDVLAAGPIVRDVSASFDAYWNSPYAVPAAAVIARAGEAEGPEDAYARLADLALAARDSSYGRALSHRFGTTLAQGNLQLTWVPALLVSDPPQKAAGDLEGLPIVASVVAPYFEAAEREVFVASAYFVPRAGGERWLGEMEARGVDVTILTNSYDSNDVMPVYAHYARSRKRLMQSGVDLWELRPDRAREDRQGLGLGLSQSGLHAKTFIIDQRYLFVGSFNWDPRSVKINTEMGILMDAPGFSRAATAGFRKRLYETSYRLRLDPGGGIYWQASDADGTLRIYPDEPTASRFGLMLSRIVGVLPIGNQL